MDLKIKGKKALVFGSSAGIGKAIAEALLKEGAEVCLNSRNETKLAQIKKEMGAHDYICSDLSRPNAGKDLVEEYLKRHGSLDILVTNTGGPAKGNFLEVSTEQWMNDFQNLWMSTVDAMKSALVPMKKQKWGRIILITSVAAKEPLASLTTSNGLRAGLSGLCKSASREFAADGITINVILPGYTNTDRLKELKLSDEFVKSVVPAGRLGKPEELGDLAAFLASDSASYITGQSISIDGGFLKGW